MSSKPDDSEPLFSRRRIIECAGESVVIDGRRCLFWPEKRILAVADLHLGKAGDFRRQGIPVPAGVTGDILSRLDAVLTEYEPSSVLILGDLFHSPNRSDLEPFRAFLSSRTDIRWEIMKGNHDRGFRSGAEALGMTFHDRDLFIAPFLFHHGDTPLEAPEGAYEISGHVHPGIRLHGSALQKEVLPCFVLGEGRATLPAFGDFTGMHLIRPRPGDRIFGIVGSGICAIPI